MKTLVINAGSSSLKFKLYEMPAETLLCAGSAERIGSRESHLRYMIPGGGHADFIEQPAVIADHGDALKHIADLISGGSQTPALINSSREIALVGHRIVHGGDAFSDAVILSPEVKDKIRRLIPFAPLHNPVGLHCIEMAEHSFPDAVQVAVFDTAFHHGLPEQAARYALPRSMYDDAKVRVYGFHGISHQYVTGLAREYLQNEDARIISIHLGNGCSITAVRGSQSLDTSMGFSPLSGLVMGTRSGDLDPAVVLHLLREEGFGVEQIDDLLNKQSGLLGLSGHGDMRDIHRAAEGGDREAVFACRLYAYRIKKYIGAYIAVLNGLDAILFTAGVGENDPVIRRLICQDLGFFNIELDETKNSASTKGVYEIGIDGSPVKILVVSTDEELEIARQAAKF